MLPFLYLEQLLTIWMTTKRANFFQLKLIHYYKTSIHGNNFITKVMEMMRICIDSISIKTTINSFNKKKLNKILTKLVKMNLWIWQTKNFQQCLLDLFLKHQIKRNLFLELKVCKILLIGPLQEKFLKLKTKDNVDHAGLSQLLEHLKAWML